MYAELKNFQKFGTPEYVMSGDLVGRNLKYSSLVSRITVNKAISRLERAAKAYEKTAPDFAKKVAGFVWEQKIENKKYLENDPLHTDNLKYINSAKNIREDLKGITFDESADLASRQAKIGGPEGKLAQLRQKYNKAKLLLGKKEYDRVGKVLGWIETSFKTLEESEKKRDEMNKQGDPRANRISGASTQTS